MHCVQWMNTYTGHSTAAGHWENNPFKCILPPATLFSIMKMSIYKSESEIRLCFAYWFSGIASRMDLCVWFILETSHFPVKINFATPLPPSILGLSPPIWKWVECPAYIIVTYFEGNITSNGLPMNQDWL